VTDRQTTNRRTDHVTQKCAEINGIVCARAIPPKNEMFYFLHYPVR